MNSISLHKLLIILFSLLLSGIMPLRATQPENPPYQEQSHTMQGQFLSNHLSHYRAIDCILQDLLLLIANNAVNVNNKQRSIENIKNIKELIIHVSNQPFVTLDAYTLDFLGILSKAIMRHIIAALNNHLIDFPPFSTASVIHRHTLRKAITLDDVHSGIIRNTKTLEQLTLKAQVAGLRWYHKAYRKLDRHIIQPSLKYDLPTRSALLLGLGFLAMQTAFQTEYEFKRFPWFRRWLGPYPQYDGGGNSLLSEYHKNNPLKGYGNLNKFFIDMTKGYGPLTTFTFSAMAAYLIIERDKIKNFLTKKIIKLHNIFKGGTYAEKPESKFICNPRVKFSDLVGLNHAKNTLSFIVQYLENPERFDRANLTPEKGYLLTGPTRTGKSYMAEALAGEIKEMYKRQGKNPEDFNFFVLSASFVITSGIENIIADAKRLAPCVLFIDEIDLLGLQRAGGNSELLSKFLTGMSGCLESDPEKVVIVLAATNKPENMDEALRQCGRFGKEIRFEYPTLQERKEYLIKKISTLANINAFDTNRLAQETEGKSFEHINSMIKSAFQKSIMRGHGLTQEMLDLALDEEIRGIIFKNSSEPSLHERKIIAAHQAGHALAIMLLENNEHLAKVTIKQYLAKLREEAAWDQFYQAEDTKQKKIQYGKIYTFHTHETKDLHDLNDKIAQIKIQLSGFAAEQIILGSCGYGYHTEDAHCALEIAKSIVSEGLTLSQLPDDIKKQYIAKALELKQQYAQEIHALLHDHAEQLNRLFAALLNNSTLTGKEVADVIGLPYPENVSPCMTDTEVRSRESELHKNIATLPPKHQLHLYAVDNVLV